MMKVSYFSTDRQISMRNDLECAECVSAV